MNIIVKTFDGALTFRPDTSWEKASDDFYVPDFVEELSYAPVLFARIGKAGRSVGEAFADRYYDSVGYGILLYPENMIDGSETGFAAASCLDHTSFLTLPFFDKGSLASSDARFVLNAGGREVFAHDGADGHTVCRLICEATRIFYIRTGDVVALELDRRRPLCRREDGRLQVTGSFLGKRVLDFNIIY